MIVLTLCKIKQHVFTCKCIVILISLSSKMLSMWKSRMFSNIVMFRIQEKFGCLAQFALAFFNCFFMLSWSCTEISFYCLLVFLNSCGLSHNNRIASSLNSNSNFCSSSVRELPPRVASIIYEVTCSSFSVLSATLPPRRAL